MADYDASAVEALLAAAEDSDHELVKHLRGVAAGKFESATQPQEPVSQMSDQDMQELASFRRAALFDQAGIGNSSNEEKLFRQAFGSREGLTLEQIQAEAANYGLTGEQASESNPASPAEMAAHDAINDSFGDAPAPPPDLEEQIARTENPEQLYRLMRSHGFEIEGQRGIDFL